MGQPADKSKLPKWWKPVEVRRRALYEIAGLTYNDTRKTLNVVALDEIFAAKTARDQFGIVVVESITLKLGVVWVPERL